MNRCVAVIPARGGSKRLPRKNILDILGRPMLSYPVGTAIASGLFDQVIVSTEDEEIAGIAESFGARVMERPAELARDRSTVVQVCTHVLDTLEKEGDFPDYFCCIYATALFITPEDIGEAYKNLAGPISDRGRENGLDNRADDDRDNGLNHDPDVVMGVSEFNLQPVQALERNREGFLSHKWPEYTGRQSQFQPRLTASNGTFYWAKARAFDATTGFYPERLAGYQIPWLRAIDIDTPEDLENARRLAPIFLKNRL
ncbi:MAG: acylneuraminate cytidylyltransferase family protein [Desulfobacter sp.]|nr:MAG: acylneuraminate cytidylyltransferase family protein [Desulfobacter sp.]